MDIAIENLGGEITVGKSADGTQAGIRIPGKVTRVQIRGITN